MPQITATQFAGMAHWSERYVGLAYIEGGFNCAELVRQVQAEVFGRLVRYPAEQPADYRGQARMLREELPRHVVPIAVSETPEDGDGMVLIARGYAEHIGVLCQINAEPYVLHNFIRGGMVVLHRLSDLPSQGIKLEGVYRWI